MRHRKAGRKLNRTSSHRKAMFANMAAALIKHEQICNKSDDCNVALGISDFHVLNSIHETDAPESIKQVAGSPFKDAFTVKGFRNVVFAKTRGSTVCSFIDCFSWTG